MSGKPYSVYRFPVVWSLLEERLGNSLFGPITARIPLLGGVEVASIGVSAPDGLYAKETA